MKEPSVTLDTQMETMRAVQAGQTVLISALLQTHPEPYLLRQAVGDALERLMQTTPSQALSAEAAQQARFYVEWLDGLLACQLPTAAGCQLPTAAG